MLRYSSGTDTPEYALALKCSQLFSTQLERLVSPEGRFPPLGRSATYRVAAFSSLTQMALINALPPELPPAQVRCALTAVLKRMYAVPGTFEEQGWLQRGFAGHQPEMAAEYTSTGSLYLCTNGFLALGLPAEHAFWNDAAQDWTAKKAWLGQAFPRDHAL